MGSYSAKRRQIGSEDRPQRRTSFLVLLQDVLQQESDVLAAATEGTPNTRSSYRKILVAVICVLLVLANGSATIGSILYAMTPDEGLDFENNTTYPSVFPREIVPIAINPEVHSATQNPKWKRTSPRWKDDTFQRTKVHVFNNGKSRKYSKRYGYESISMY